MHDTEITTPTQQRHFLLCGAEKDRRYGGTSTRAAQLAAGCRSAVSRLQGGRERSIEVRRLLRVWPVAGQALEGGLRFGAIEAAGLAVVGGDQPATECEQPGGFTQLGVDEKISVSLEHTAKKNNGTRSPLERHRCDHAVSGAGK